MSWITDWLSGKQKPDLYQTDGTNVRCCATCSIWRVGIRAYQEDPNRCYCDVQQGVLPDSDLRYWGCNAWVEDTRESYAVDLANHLRYGTPLQFQDEDTPEDTDHA